MRWLLLMALALGACGDLEAGGMDVDAGPADDTLAVPDEAAPGSLDELTQEIFVPSCGSTPGLCHNGQFEPNLSTPALAYSYLVNRPGIEKDKTLRVSPGNPSESLLIHKLRNIDVATQMPLGAEPLAEEEIQAIEEWIRQGALRRPGADPAPVLNNPPMPPEIGVFDAGGARLDTAGPVTVAPGTTLTLRQSVKDFETDDAAIPFAVFLLQTADGWGLVLSPTAQDPAVGVASYDPAAPQGNGDLLNWRLDVTIGATVTLVDDAGTRMDVPSSGLVFSVIAAYLDGLPQNGGMATIAFRVDLLQVE